MASTSPCCCSSALIYDEINAYMLLNSFASAKSFRRKKKYAALVVTEKSNGELAFTRQEKGLDLVRRDWCDLSVEMGRYVLDQILSGKPREDVLDEIHSYLRTQSALIREGKIPPEKFAISKTMTKKPEEYPDAHTQPHVQVALALRSQVRITK